jgi:hypothetical protein
VGNQTSYTLTGLVDGATYSFVVNVYNTSGIISSDSNVLAVTLPASNRPPVAVADTATTPAGAPVTSSVLANDSAPDGNPLTITAATQGAHGTVTFTITSVTYTPVSTYSGTDSFTYTITLARAYPKINIFALIQGFQKRSDLVSGPASKQGTAQLEQSARRAENHFRLAHPKVSNVSLRDFDFGVCLKNFTTTPAGHRAETNRPHPKTQ